MKTENVSEYYELYVAETKAHNACALREQSLLKDVEFAGREMERLKDELEKEKADHLDTQHKWNEALDIGIGVLKERDSLRSALAGMADLSRNRTTTRITLRDRIASVLANNKASNGGTPAK